MLTQLVFALLLNPNAHAWNMSLTANQAQEKVQAQSGKEDSDPISYGLGFGHEFQWWNSTQFAPRMGYVMNTVNSDDHYSGKYKVETIYLLYDFAHPFNSEQTWWWRVGIGNFIKRIKGNGGTVEIPNGSGTSTAYKPGKTQESYTSTLNLGVDWMFSKGMGGNTINGYGMNFETFWNELLDSKKRMFTVQLAFTAYF